MKRRLRQVVLTLLGALALVATVVVLVADSGRFAWFGSCGSDRLSVVQGEIERYRAEHGGALPGSSAEFVAYMTSARGADQFRCVTGRSYVWRPGLRDEKGREVVVMCPPGSHGLIRRFSLALVAADPALWPCLVRGSRVESID